MNDAQRELEKRRESAFHGMGGREPLADVPPEREEAVQPETSEQRVAERQLHELFKPSVLHLRRELFDNERPRFDSWADAVGWIKREAERGTGDPNSEEEASRLVGELLERVERLNQLGGPRRSLQFEHGPPLQYVEPGEEWARHLRVTAGSPLGVLAEGCDAVARAGGFQRWKVVRWVLTGEEPTLPPARVRAHHVNVELPDGRSLRRYYATVEINVQPVRGLTYDQWKRLRELLRGIWGRPLPHTLTEREVVLLELVEQRGGPPGDPDTKKGTPWKSGFWEDVRKELEERGIQGQRGPYQRFQSVAKAYYRAQEKAADIPWIQFETREGAS